MIAQLKEYAFYKPSNCTLQMGNGMYLNKTVKKKKKLDVVVLSYET